MVRRSNGAVFNQSLLPDGEKRWGWFGIGFVLECIALAIVVVLPMLMPQKLEAVRSYWVMPLEAPHIEAWKPQPPPKPMPVVKRQIVKEIPKPVEIEVPKPKIYNPVITAPVAKVAKKAPVPDPTQLAKAFPDPNPPVSLGSSALPTLKKPREEVQTGGFGDPDGVRSNGKTDRNPNIAQLGGYDLPTGAGQGNGTAAANGSKGVVASTGFGSGVAIGTAGTGNHGTVQQGSFADEHASTAAPRIRQTAAVSNSKPVEILFKPKPEYTDEARTKKIEGEVLLQVVFAASGEVKVERVVQGLGYGLDGSAEAAARQIRFRPAQQEGQPVDSNAIVHITFALAY
ncbi:MAG: TonB family protein [Candidatus Acidiferrales bacterium]|jgi:TonB family protein